MKHVLLSPGRYDQPLHEGVAAYAADHGWMLNSELVRGLGKRKPYLGWDCGWDGVIGELSEEDATQERTMAPRCHRVMVNNNAETPYYPSVSTNVHKTAAMAFDFFRRRGFRHFGIYGWELSPRLKAFKSLVESEVGYCRVLYNSYSNIVTESKRICTWLKEGPTPVAIFANNDDDGSSFVNIAVEAGFAIPRDIAVLGTDDSQLTGKSCRVPLSSVDTNLFQVGYQAAEKLDRLMNGDTAVELQTLIDPKGVVERASTETIGAVSPHVRRAFDIMEADYEKGITIGDVIADLGISHAGLIKAFRRELGYTPASALRDIRMKSAAQLLTSTDQKMRAIASAVGMGNVDYFQTAFKRHFGMTPRKYRLEAKEN